MQGGEVVRSNPEEGSPCFWPWARSCSASKPSTYSSQGRRGFCVQGGESTAWQLGKTAQPVPGLSRGLVDESHAGTAPSEQINVASGAPPTADGSIGIDTLLLHRGRALLGNFSDVSFEGLSHLTTMDRDTLLLVSKHVNDPIKLRKLNWPSVLSSQHVKALFADH